jgi:hypothetical protein
MDQSFPPTNPAAVEQCGEKGLGLVVIRVWYSLHDILIVLSFF